jgi:hypothetical protein
MEEIEEDGIFFHNRFVFDPTGNVDNLERTEFTPFITYAKP